MLLRTMFILYIYMFTYVGKMSPMITFMGELHGCVSTFSPFLPINSSSLFISGNTQFSESFNRAI